MLLSDFRGCVTGCTAASIAMAVAETVTGCDMGLVEQLPDTGVRKHGGQGTGAFLGSCNEFFAEWRVVGAAS